MNKFDTYVRQIMEAYKDPQESVLWPLIQKLQDKDGNVRKDFDVMRKEAVAFIRSVKKIRNKDKAMLLGAIMDPEGTVNSALSLYKLIHNSIFSFAGMGMDSTRQRGY